MMAHVISASHDTQGHRFFCKHTNGQLMLSSSADLLRMMLYSTRERQVPLKYFQQAIRLLLLMWLAGHTTILLKGDTNPAQQLLMNYLRGNTAAADELPGRQFSSCCSAARQAASSIVQACAHAQPRTGCSSNCFKSHTLSQVFPTNGQSAHMRNSKMYSSVRVHTSYLLLRQMPGSPVVGFSGVPLLSALPPGSTRC